MRLLHSVFINKDDVDILNSNVRKSAASLADGS